MEYLDLDLIKVEMRHTDFGTVPCCHAEVRQTPTCTIQNFLLAIKKEPPFPLSKKFGSPLTLGSLRYFICFCKTVRSVFLDDNLEYICNTGIMAFLPIIRNCIFHYPNA